MAGMTGMARMTARVVFAFVPLDSRASPRMTAKKHTRQDQSRREWQPMGCLLVASLLGRWRQWQLHHEGGTLAQPGIELHPTLMRLSDVLHYSKA